MSTLRSSHIITTREAKPPSRMRTSATRHDRQRVVCAMIPRMVGQQSLQAARAGLDALDAGHIARYGEAKSTFDAARPQRRRCCHQPPRMR